jgi:predicted NACHT family NTPase
VIEAMQEQLFALTNFELRAHPSWHNILELYRSALAALVNGSNPAQAKAILQQAQHRRLVEIEYHQKLLDYTNWFEVTKDYEPGDSHFNSYFTTAKEMERVQADPAHPNPMRANLLQLESEL